MKTLTLCFAVAALFSTTAYAASSPEVAKCMELPDNEFMAQLDCLDPILAKSKADLDNAYKAKIASFNGDKKAIQALDKQQKDWKKSCPNPVEKQVDLRKVGMWRHSKLMLPTNEQPNSPSNLLFHNPDLPTHSD